MKRQISTQSKRIFTFHGIDLLYFNQVDSTNNILKEMVLKNNHPVRAVAANSQTKGRGRLGRPFFSPSETGLYLSLLYNKEDFSQDPLSLTVYAAAAAAAAIEDTLSITTGIKWVNDLYYHNKKCAGILAEGIIRKGELDAIILGIGINLWHPLTGFPDDIADIAGSLLGNQPPDDQLRHTLLQSLLSHLYPLPDHSKIMDYYRDHSIVIGKQVQLTGTGAPTLSGIVTDIDDHGALILFSEGKYHTIRSGEISLSLTTSDQS